MLVWCRDMFCECWDKVTNILGFIYHSAGRGSVPADSELMSAYFIVAHDVKTIFS